jgi:hypothetical protein
LLFGGELYAQVTKKQGRLWVFRYERLGHERWIGLGPLGDVSLEEAREDARAARKQLRKGIDPLDADKAIRWIEKYCVRRHSGVLGLPDALQFSDSNLPPDSVHFGVTAWGRVRLSVLGY